MSSCQSEEYLAEAVMYQLTNQRDEGVVGLRLGHRYRLQDQREDNSYCHRQDTNCNMLEFEPDSSHVWQGPRQAHPMFCLMLKQVPGSGNGLVPGSGNGLAPGSGNGLVAGSGNGLGQPVMRQTVPVPGPPGPPGPPVVLPNPWVPQAPCQPVLPHNNHH